MVKGEIETGYQCPICDERTKTEKEGIKCYKNCAYLEAKSKYGDLLEVEITKFNNEQVIEEVF